MSLLVVYVGVVIMGNLIAYFVGLVNGTPRQRACRRFWRCIFCSSGFPGWSRSASRSRGSGRNRYLRGVAAPRAFAL
jgi:hypothetical protein